MRPTVETSFTPEIYATFIFSRWILGDAIASSARRWVEVLICRYIEVVGKPKTVQLEKRAAIAALSCLSMKSSVEFVKSVPTESYTDYDNIELLLARARVSRE